MALAVNQRDRSNALTPEALGAGGAQSKKFQRVIENLKLRGLRQFFLKRMNGAFFYWNRCATVEAGEIVTIFCGQGIEPFATGLSPGLNQSFDLQGSERPVDCRQPHGLLLGLKPLIDSLGCHGAVSLTEQRMNRTLTMGQPDFEVIKRFHWGCATQKL